MLSHNSPSVHQSPHLFSFFVECVFSSKQGFSTLYYKSNVEIGYFN